MAAPTSIDAYLAPLSEEKRAALETLRATIRAAAPGAEECISYGIPAFRLNGMPVGFGATSKHAAGRGRGVRSYGLVRSLCACATIAFAVACSKSPASDPEALARAEQAVYDAAAKDFAADTVFKDTLFVEQKSIEYKYGGVRANPIVKDIRDRSSPELAEAFAVANATQGVLARAPSGVLRPTVFGNPPAAVLGVSVLSFSRPGFNAAGDSAVVEFRLYCGGLCGYGRTLLMVKQPDGTWRIAERLAGYVS